MRENRNIITCSILLAFFFFLLPSNVSAGWWNSGPQCDDIVDRGYINVVTFNILFFSEVASVETRLQPFVDWLVDQTESVDVIFLQEVVGGKLALSEFTNSARLLKDMLLAEGVEYNLRTAFEIGVPGVFYSGNAILSRCEIKFSFVKRLPRTSEIEILGQVIEVPRNVQMTRLKIPGFGKFNAYNTHLCAGCDAGEREEQLLELFNFIDTIENFIPGENPILLAGDFNIDRIKNAEEPLYQSIIEEEFVDAYAEYFVSTDLLDTLCEDENDSDEHCTVGNTYFDSIEQGKASRIDYIFRKGFGVTSFAEVFFNNLDSDPPVSDHSAVLTEIPLLTSE